MYSIHDGKIQMNILANSIHLYEYTYIYSHVWPGLNPWVEKIPWRTHSRILAWRIPWTVWSSSVTQSCLTLYNPMDCSTPGFPVHHQLPEFARTLIPRVGDAIQPSHALLSVHGVPKSQTWLSDSRSHTHTHTQVTYYSHCCTAETNTTLYNCVSIKFFKLKNYLF